MHMIAGEIVSAGRGLSPTLAIIGIVLGGLLWLCGWRWHRFWVVITVTVAGGLYGLQSGRDSDSHLIAMGVLVALSAGMMALELARVLAFIGAGTAMWMLAGLLFPQGRELWVAFMLGGLIGILLYRFWTMLLTSFLGIEISWHAFLILADSQNWFDGENYADRYTKVFNGAVIAAAACGIVAQSWLERWYHRRKKKKKQEAESKIRESEREKVLAEIPPPVVPATIWDKIMGRKKAA